MDWASEYRRERRATWEDLAESVRESVTIRDALGMYVPGYEPKHNRIPCPIHQGKDYNFSFTSTGYKCFVCGAGGDVIALVKEVCELSTRADSIRRINADFRLNLPIGCEITQAENEALRARREAQRERERKRQEWEDGYRALWDEWCRLDRQKMFCKPGTGAWIEAVTNIDRVAYDIDCYPAEPR